MASRKQRVDSHLLLGRGLRRGSADAVAAVRAGMEIASWTPSHEDWVAWVTRYRDELAAGVRLFERWSIVGGVATVGLGTGAGLAVGATAAFALGGAAFAIGVVIPLAAFLLDHTKVTSSAQFFAERPPSVLLTSTGIEYGRLAQLWHGERARLAEVELRGAGPPVLVLTFRPVGWQGERFALTVPLPAAVAPDGSGLVGELRALAG